MPARKRRTKRGQTTACADYSFRQRFRVPASFAFAWCVDYRPDDFNRVGIPGTRTIEWIGPTTVVLDDGRSGTDGRSVHKVRMVQVYPERYQWINTHVGGPRVHSQFRYTISPDSSKSSVLLFEGRELRWDGRRLSAAANARLARELRDEDAALWKKLAAWMERDYRKR